MTIRPYSSVEFSCGCVLSIQPTTKLTGKYNAITACPKHLSRYAGYTEVSA